MGQIAPRGANEPFRNHWEASARGANAYPPAVSNWEVEVRLILPCSCYFVIYKTEAKKSNDFFFNFVVFCDQPWSKGHNELGKTDKKPKQDMKPGQGQCLPCLHRLLWFQFGVVVCAQSTAPHCCSKIPCDGTLHPWSLSAKEGRQPG
eukprot:g74591.t1